MEGVVCGKEGPTQEGAVGKISENRRPGVKACLEVGCLNPCSLYLSFLDPEDQLLESKSRAYESYRIRGSCLPMVILMVDEIHIQELLTEYTVGLWPEPLFLAFLMLSDIKSTV